LIIFTAPDIIAYPTFTQAFGACLQEVTGGKYAGCREMFEAWSQLSQPVKHGFWRKVGSMCQISQKQAHDYFHVYWSKEYYASINPYKKAFLAIMKKMLEANQNAQIVEVVQAIKEQFPDLQFHYQTLYQFVNYQMRVMSQLVRPEAKEVPSPHSQPEKRPRVHDANLSQQQNAFLDSLFDRLDL